MSGLRGVLFSLILLAYLIIGSIYASLTPAWQAPDEPAHYNYVHFVASQGSFPELVQGCYDEAYLTELKSRRFPPESSVGSICYEFHQPPLYYSLASAIFTVSNGSLLALRLFSLLLGAGVVALTFFIGQTVLPDRTEVSLGAMAFVAFVPMHLAMVASANNDVLAELILAGLLLLLTRRLVAPTPPSSRADLLLGLLLGLGLITKTTVYIAIPLTVITLWWAAPQRNWVGLGRPALLVFGLALLLALPWYLRNAALYGKFDLLGLGRHDEVVIGQLRTADFLAEVGWSTYLSNFATITFHSFWGQFGWMAVPMDGRTYLLLGLLSLIALGGLVGFGYSCFSNRAEPRYRLSTGLRRALGLLALTISLMILGYLWYNLTFVQFQGRYLFPALIPLGLFFALGLAEAVSLRWRWWLAWGLGVALAWLVVSGLLGGNLDKWAILLVGLAFALAAGRAWLARRWLVPAGWLLAICYASLAGLAALSPLWFVIPYLSP